MSTPQEPNAPADDDLRMAKLMEAYSPQQALHYKLMMNRIGVPYMVKNENLQSLYNAMGEYNVAMGPVEFLVPEHLLEQARRQLQDLQRVHEETIPETCPACSAANPERQTYCPECGLFLG